jgi:phospholipid/cholesterol/gamma-HCH transport system substrate-binding protein
MTNRTINNAKLGAFVLGGLLFLVLLLYMIGKNSNLFGNTYALRARFGNIKGLMVGNNVRFAGIETGTVKKIAILNDTVIEVTMLMDEKMKTIIRKNAMASIGTEGVVGNKVINIMPSAQPGEYAEENDLLSTLPSIDTDEMLLTLDETNNNIAEMTSGLKTTIQQINNSNALWTLLSDKSIPYNIRASISKIHEATDHANEMVLKMDSMFTDVQNGKGSVGALLTDTSYAQNIAEILVKIQQVSDEADSLVNNINGTVAEIRFDMQRGGGTANSFLKDSTVFMKVHTSLDNIQKGTENFNKNMEALKHNFLFKGYYKKQEKQARKAEEKSKKP